MLKRKRHADVMEPASRQVPLSEIAGSGIQHAVEPGRVRLDRFPHLFRVDLARVASRPRRARFTPRASRRAEGEPVHCADRHA